MIKKEQLFPIVLIVLQIAASIPYFINGNVKRAIYWIAAGILNICVTF